MAVTQTVTQTIEKAVEEGVIRIKLGLGFPRGHDQG